MAPCSATTSRSDWRRSRGRRGARRTWPASPAPSTGCRPEHGRSARGSTSAPSRWPVARAILDVRSADLDWRSSRPCLAAWCQAAIDGRDAALRGRREPYASAARISAVARTRPRRGRMLQGKRSPSKGNDLFGVYGAYRPALSPQTYRQRCGIAPSGSQATVLLPPCDAGLVDARAEETHLAALSRQAQRADTN